MNALSSQQQTAAQHSRRLSPARLAYFASNTLLVAMGALVLFGRGPHPLWLLLAIFAHLALLGFGALNMQWEMYGPALHRRTDKPSELALTFDDGPDPETTPRVLDILKQNDAKATFFVVGFRAEQHPELLQRIVAEGHSLGVHSYDHNLAYAMLTPQVVQADIQRCQRIIADAVGFQCRWFRPPVGQMSPRTVQGIRRAGVTAVGWSVRAADGIRRCTSAQALARVLPGLKGGAIVLMHDAWLRPRTRRDEQGNVLRDSQGREQREAPPASLAVLDEILKTSRERGLNPVTLDQFSA